jgi:hypothetical protein
LNPDDDKAQKRNKLISSSPSSSSPRFPVKELAGESTESSGEVGFSNLIKTQVPSGTKEKGEEKQEEKRIFARRR